jgi:hypothetical protein
MLPLRLMRAAAAMICHFNIMSRHHISIMNCIRAALITGIFAAFVVYLPTERTQPGSGISVSYASIQMDILNHVSISNIKEIHGVKIIDFDRHKIEYYFEYEANALDTLKIIASLPSAIDDNVSSVAPMLMESDFNPLEVSQAFTEEARDATSFFWNAKAEDYTFYECIKSPMKHTLLISKTSARILHKVESII